MSSTWASTTSASGSFIAGRTNDKPGDPISMIYHDFTPEVYIITSGTGVLTTGGVIENRRQGTGVPNVMNGPSAAARPAQTLTGQKRRRRRRSDDGAASVEPNHPIT